MQDLPSGSSSPLEIQPSGGVERSKHLQSRDDDHRYPRSRGFQLIRRIMHWCWVLAGGWLIAALNNIPNLLLSSDPITWPRIQHALGTSFLGAWLTKHPVGIVFGIVVVVVLIVLGRWANVDMAHERTVLAERHQRQEQAEMKRAFASMRNDAARQAIEKVSRDHARAWRRPFQDAVRGTLKRAIPREINYVLSLILPSLRQQETTDVSMRQPNASEKSGKALADISSSKQGPQEHEDQDEVRNTTTSSKEVDSMSSLASFESHLGEQVGPASNLYGDDSSSGYDPQVQSERSIAADAVPGTDRTLADTDAGVSEDDKPIGDMQGRFRIGLPQAADTHATMESTRPDPEGHGHQQQSEGSSPSTSAPLPEVLHSDKGLTEADEGKASGANGAKHDDSHWQMMSSADEQALAAAARGKEGETLLDWEHVSSEYELAYVSDAEDGPQTAPDYPEDFSTEKWTTAEIRETKADQMEELWGRGGFAPDQLGRIEREQWPEEIVVAGFVQDMQWANAASVGSTIVTESIILEVLQNCSLEKIGKVLRNRRRYLGLAPADISYDSGWVDAVENGSWSTATSASQLFVPYLKRYLTAVSWTIAELQVNLMPEDQPI